MPPNVSLLIRFTPHRARARSGRGAWRDLPAFLCAVVLAVLGACAPDAPTAPGAALGAPQRLLVPAAGYMQVSAGGSHSCALAADGALACWGDNTYGQATPPAGTGYTQVSAGAYHSCALAADGALACWGHDADGLATPPAGTGYTQVSAGHWHSCALAADGALACWGHNAFGRATPPAGTGYTQVSAGGDHSCAVAAGGALACWGDNAFGQLNGVPTGTGYTQVSAGAYHSCALAADGALACWGDDSFGRTRPPAGTGYTQVSVGTYHSCALAADGALACWGDNYRRQATPPAGTGYRHVDAGKWHTCAVTAAATLACWGDNSSGRATPPALPAPTHVLPTATFTAPPAAVAGQAFTLALGDAQVPGHPAATQFTYAFDCGDGAGYAAASGNATTSCPTAAVGTRAVRGKVIDQDGDTASYGATVTVNQAAQTAAFTSTPPSPAYVGATYAVSATATSGLAAVMTSQTPAVCTLAGGPSSATVTFAAAGICTLTADQAGDATYAAAPRATQSITVVRRPQTVTVTTTLPASALVTSVFTLAATGGASGHPVVFGSQTPATCTTTGANGTTLTLVAAGACRVQATQAGTTTYAPAEPVPLTVTVLSAAQGVTQLRAAVMGAGLKADVRRGLTDKLDAAAAALAAGDTGTACGALAAFQNQVVAQGGKGIPPATAEAWLAQAAQLRRAAGC